MSDKRNLRIFCPTHEAAFEVADSPKILCEITEHALSIGFPTSEFWEFCCNCETFAPAKLDKGEKAQKTCFACGNEISKRFACAECKVVSFESNEKTKGRSYFLNDNGIEPACPGCHKISHRAKLLSHQCEEIEARYFTERAECPFCLERTAVEKNQLAGVPTSAIDTVCPKCNAENPLSANFCGKCKWQLREDLAIASLGSDTNKTQLLGSLCPNCSTPIPINSEFCGECGQAVKKSAVAPPPPSPPQSQITAESSNTDQQLSPTAGVSMNNQTRIFLTYFGAACFVVVIIAIILAVSNSSNKSTSFNGNSNKSNSESRASNSRPSESFSVVGKYAFVSTNVNVRTGPDKNYEDIGTFFQDTKVKILQVSRREGDSDWWEVVVENSNDYGCSSVDSSICGKDNPSDASRGWINSKNALIR